jgi:hypothetical protein
MKSLISIFVIVAAACLSACGNRIGGGGAPPPSNGNEWTWMGGSNAANQPGAYGTLGIASVSNAPGARQQAVSWSDSSGSFWLFGGSGEDSTGNSGVPLNDLWKYSAGEWTWMSGANVGGQSGVYGTQGVAAASNVPGARFGAVGSTDEDGELWLFGGYFISPNGPSGNGILNDLWKYSAGGWAWISGSDTFNQGGTYGTQGIAAAGNAPGARFGAASWIDASGNFWLFGGSGVDSNGNCCVFFNDLWEYTSGAWAWVGGSNVGNQQGNYGTQGMAAPGNIPGARDYASSWTDASGNFWLFGGNGLDNGGGGNLNDLWKYSSGEWTWMSGSSSPDEIGAYGTQGTAAPANVPGARFGAVSWTDASGNLWLFGGANYDQTGTGGTFDDLWKYSAGEWTWMGGSSVMNQQGTYGSQGTADPMNDPGARYFAVGWTDASGNFWLFGGQYGIESTSSQSPLGSFNDLWIYEP